MSSVFFLVFEAGRVLINPEAASMDFVKLGEDDLELNMKVEATQRIVALGLASRCRRGCKQVIARDLTRLALLEAVSLSSGSNY